jgi:GTP cyclohydrolase I
MQFIGADMDDPNCIDTPRRVMKAWRDYWGVGYKQKSSDFLTVFPNEGYNQLVVVENIPVNSTCSHHLAPIHGTAIVAIIPNKELIGLSKYARIVDMYSRRLQLQERLTQQIADELMSLLRPLGVAVCIRAEHMCMSSRGVKIHNAVTTTTALTGVFMTNPETRSEFMSLVK